MAGRRTKISRLVEDIKSGEAIERLMKSRGVDLTAPVLAADPKPPVPMTITRLTRVGDLVGSLVVKPAVVAPAVGQVSDHVADIRFGSPNRKQASSDMKHHRINR